MPSIYCNAAFKIMKRQHICHNTMILRLTNMVFFMVDANNNYHSPLSWRLKTDIWNIRKLFVIKMKLFVSEISNNQWWNKLPTVQFTQVLFLSLIFTYFIWVFQFSATIYILSITLVTSYRFTLVSVYMILIVLCNQSDIVVDGTVWEDAASEPKQHIITLLHRSADRYQYRYRYWPRITISKISNCTYSFSVITI